jgi:uncharacterized protein
MKFEWDENKRRRNLRKHGLDFLGCEVIFEGPTVTIEDSRFAYQEQRFITIGLLDGRLVVVAHTETKDLIGIISIRKAKRHEQTIWYKSIVSFDEIPH